jgi:hypothetical protein
MEYTLSSHDGFLEAKTAGDAEVAKLVAMTNDILAHPRWADNKRVLVDHSELNTASLSTEQVHALVHRNASARARVGKARVAILVARSLEFGMVRMWESLIASQWDATTNCFTSRKEAIAWLR